jgi:hypothetical protein
MTAELDPATRLAVGVIRRALAGECVELREKILTHYDPTPHLCHHNAREWVAVHPEHKHVYGFLVANHRETDTSMVIAHSVVEDTEGRLCDITPNDAENRYPFVRHIGSDDEFELIAGKEPFLLEIPNSLLRQLGVI